MPYKNHEGQWISFEEWVELREKKKDGIKLLSNFLEDQKKVIATFWNGFVWDDDTLIFETVVFTSDTLDVLESKKWSDKQSALIGHDEILKKYLERNE